MNRRPFTPLVRTTLLAAALAAAGCTTTLSVTGHSEEALNWCGPAAGQTIIGGYPGSPPPPCAVTPPAQADVWDQIQANKVEAAWDSDPAGLRAALMNLCPPPGGGWSVFAENDATVLMHAVAKWMKLREYPVAALLGTDGHNSFSAHREHWVTITEIVTDVDPVANPTVNLISVSIIDQPPVFGDPPVQRLIMASDWYASELRAVSLGSSAYVDQFVAIIEPPPSRGTAVAAPLPVSGALIGPARAVAAARELVRRKPRSRMAFLRNLSKLRPATPLLVNPEERGYYLVPFTGGKRSMAVLVNAYNGAIQEVAEYQPRPILPEPQAIALASRFLGRKTDDARASLVSAPDGGSPLFPVWRVAAGNDVVLIGPDGNVARGSTARVKP